MDRNADGAVSGSGDYVALRKESVDRNIHTQNLCVCVIQSLSARRAWIEIHTSRLPRSGTVRSLSARRAWIEIGVMEFGPGEVFGRSPQGERG